MPLGLNLPRTSLLGFCPIEAAVFAMAGSGIEARGAVFAQRELVDFILDLASYTSGKPLHQTRLLDRYNILCRKRLYPTATVLGSPRTAADSGDYTDLSELTSLKTFITSFVGHIAAEAARSQNSSLQ